MSSKPNILNATSIDYCMEDHSPLPINAIEFKEDIAMVDAVDKIMNKYDADHNGYLDKDECM